MGQAIIPERGETMPGFAHALAQAVTRLTEEFEAKADDGLEVGEVFAFVFACAGELAALGHQYLDTPDAQKRRLTLQALRKLYRRFDPDIPLLPEMVEPFVESAILSYVLPAVYDLATSRV